MIIKIDDTATVSIISLWISPLLIVDILKIVFIHAIHLSYITNNTDPTIMTSDNSAIIGVKIHDNIILHIYVCCYPYYGP